MAPVHSRRRARHRTGDPREQAHPPAARRCAAALALATLLALLGKAVVCDCQAVQAVLETLKRLHPLGP